MPVKLVTPIEIVRKDAVLIDEYETTMIVINLGDKPYVSVQYAAKDASGKIVGKAEALLSADETAQFIKSNPAFYNSIKNESYKVGKSKGVIPNDAGVI